MKCPDCENEMTEKDNVLKCSECGSSYIRVDNINQECNDGLDKILDGIEDVTEQVFVQAKKEKAFIKSMIKNDSTAPCDENEFIFSKYVMDKVDYVLGKRPKFKVTINNENTESEEENKQEKVKIKVED